MACWKAGGARSLGERLPLVPPEAEVSLLQEAGFKDVEVQKCSTLL